MLEFMSTDCACSLFVLSIPVTSRNFGAVHEQILMVEPPLNERAQRQEMAAMMFETFKVVMGYSKVLTIPLF